MKIPVEHRIEFSLIKQPLYYGTPIPLGKGFFEQEKINPLGISGEAGVLCFSTSPAEVSERYAAPPRVPENANFDELMEAYKSEWFSKTNAMACAEEGLLPGANPSSEVLSKIRDSINSVASPAIYPVHVISTKPFIVSENIFMKSSRIDSNGGLNKSPYSRESSKCIEDYAQSIKMSVINRSPKKISVIDAMLMADLAINSFLEKRLGINPEKMTTGQFYQHLRGFFENHGMPSFHTDVFNGIHDSIVIENPGKYFANAGYGDNQHVMIFDVNRIVYSISGEVNKELMSDNIVSEPSI